MRNEKSKPKTAEELKHHSEVIKGIQGRVEISSLYFPQFEREN